MTKTFMALTAGVIINLFLLALVIFSGNDGAVMISLTFCISSLLVWLVCLSLEFGK